MQGPVFVVGTPRSGTTLLRLVLGSHTKLWLAPESAFLFRFANKSLPLYKFLKNKSLIQAYIEDILSIQQIRSWAGTLEAKKIANTLEANCSAADIIEAIYKAAANGKEIWGDKTPKNLSSIEQILKLFPTAKIIAIIRDGRDVALSLNKVDFAKTSVFSNTLRWRNDSREILAKKEKLLVIKYEDFLERPEEIAKEIFDYIGIENEENLLKKYLEHEDDVSHSKSSLYKEKISKSNAYKWRDEMSAKEQTITESLAANELRAFGYELRGTAREINSTEHFKHRILDLLRLSTNPIYLRNYFDFFRLFTKRVLLYPFTG